MKVLNEGKPMSRSGWRKKKIHLVTGLIVDDCLWTNLLFVCHDDCSLLHFIANRFLLVLFSVYFFEFSSYKTGKIVFVLNYSLSRLRSVIASLTQIGQRQMVLGNVAIRRWCVHISNYSFFFPSLSYTRWFCCKNIKPAFSRRAAKFNI